MPRLEINYRAQIKLFRVKFLSLFFGLHVILIAIRPTKERCGEEVLAVLGMGRDLLQLYGVWKSREIQKNSDIFADISKAPSAAVSISKPPLPSGC